MTAEQGESRLDIAKSIAAKDLQKIHKDPDEVLKLVGEAIKKFIDTGNRSFVDDFLDQSGNEKIADILTSDRKELNEDSILSVLRKIEQSKIKPS